MKINIHSIKFKTTATIIIMLFFVLLIGVLYLEPASTNIHISNARHSQMELSRQIASNLDFYFRQAIGELESVAEMPDVRSMKREKIDEVLSQYNRTTQFFGAYHALDKSGTWISHPKDPERVGQSIPERNMGWVRKTLGENRTISLDVVVTLTGLLVSGFSTPIHSDSGEPVGLLRGAIVLSDKNCVLRPLLETKVGKRGYAYIVDSNGMLIQHPKILQKAGSFKEYDYSTYTPVQKAVRGEIGIMDYEYEGQVWVAAYSPIESTGWGVIVQQPVVDIIESAHGEAGMFGTTFVITFIIGSFILSAVLVRSLSPLSRLVNGIRSKRIPEEDCFSKDEVGQLSKEFYCLYSELSQSKNALRESHLNLEALMEERTRSLRETNSELEREIAEHMRTGKALRESEQRLKTLVDAIPDIVFFKDAEGRHLIMNKANEVVLGLSREEMIGKNAEDFLPKEVAEHCRRSDSELMENGHSVRSEETLIDKDGKKLTLDTIKVPLYDEHGNAMGLIGIGRDVTERKMMEEKLTYGENYLRSIIEAEADCVMLLAPDCTVVEMNPAGLQMIEETVSENVIGTKLCPLISEEDGEEFSNFVRAVCEGKESTLRYKVSGSNGNTKWLESRGVPFRDEIYDRTLMLAVTRDVTDRVLLEQQIKAALKEKEVLLQEIHHRVKNNMQIISSLLRLQSRYINDESTVKQFFESQNRIRSMAIVHEKLYMSNNLASIDFRQYVESLTKSLRNSFAGNKCVREIKVDIDDITFNADTAIPCGLIINELVTNAFQHAFAESEEGEIRISARRNEANEVVLIVSDDGKGISESVDIEDPDSLGLELVKTLANDQLGGRIELNTSGGTEFRITFTEPLGKTII